MIKVWLTALLVAVTGPQAPVPHRALVTCPAQDVTTWDTYNAACSSFVNHGTTWPEYTLSDSTGVAFTASVSLADAIASLKFGGSELAASAGHGRAVGWNFHAGDTQASECYNPTQEGSRSDDVSATAPWHQPSTSVLFGQSSTSTEVDSAVQMGMFVQRSDPNPGFGGCVASDYQPAGQPYDSGRSSDELDSRYILSGYTVHVLSTVHVQDEVEHPYWDGVFASYTAATLTLFYSYNPATHVLTSIPSRTASTNPVLECNAAGTLCEALRFDHAVMNSAYYWVQSDPPGDYVGPNGDNILQVTVPTSNVGGAGARTLNYDVWAIVGPYWAVKAQLNTWTN